MLILETDITEPCPVPWLFLDRATRLYFPQGVRGSLNVNEHVIRLHLPSMWRPFRKG